MRKGDDKQLTSDKRKGYIWNCNERVPDVVSQDAENYY